MLFEKKEEEKSSSLRHDFAWWRCGGAWAPLLGEWVVEVKMYRQGSWGQLEITDQTPGQAMWVTKRLIIAEKWKHPKCLD